jgi:hypothetical protein
MEILSAENRNRSGTARDSPVRGSLGLREAADQSWGLAASALLFFSPSLTQPREAILCEVGIKLRWGISLVPPHRSSAPVVSQSPGGLPVLISQSPP